VEFEASFHPTGKENSLQDRRNRLKKRSAGWGGDGKHPNHANSTTTLVRMCHVHLEKTHGIKSVLQLPVFVCFDLLGSLCSSSQTETENTSKTVLKFCYDDTLIRLLCFWTLFIVLFFKCNVSENGFCLRLKVKHSNLTYRIWVCSTSLAKLSRFK
jgi:hypothetical protein